MKIRAYTDIAAIVHAYCSGAVKGLILLFLLSSIALGQPASSPEGTWEGSIDVPGGELGVIVVLARDGGNWKGTIDIPQQGAKNLNLTKISVEGEKAAFTIQGVPGNPTFNGTIAGDGSTLSGSFLQGGAALPFSLKRRTEARQQATAQAAASALEDVRRFIPEAMKDWDVPGMAIAIVRNGEVVFSEGFGYRDAERKLPVNPNTLFAIGSSTKAFTSFVVASLVEEGKLEWETPVAEYLPSFRLKDPVATQNMTPRDLLLHISGLPRHDVMWYNSSYTRRELFDRLQYLEPSAEFRSQWQYQNLMYMTAGYLAGEVAGTSWEEVVRGRIFQPLGMNRSNFSVDLMRSDSNAALPYEMKEKKVAPIEYRNIDQIGPAGSINSTVADMANWVKLHLSDGTVGGRRIASESTLDMLHAPQVVIPGNLISAKEVLFNLYAMGWFVHAYRGHRLIQHGGNIDGFTALVSMMPDDSIGVVILTNMDGTPLPMITMLTVYDRLLGFEKVDWNGKMKTQRVKGEEIAGEITGAKDIERVPGTRPSHELKDYAGEYESPAYGIVRVAVERDRLEVSYNGMSSPLDHFHYDVFRAGELPPPYDNLKIQFLANVNGAIDRISVPLEPAVEPILFTKNAPAAMSDPVALGKYAGEYTLSGVTVTVEVVGRSLALTVPGQPTYQLSPIREGEFGLKGLSGYTLRFEEEKGKVMRAIFLQPNGTFVATRK